MSAHISLTWVEAGLSGLGPDAPGDQMVSEFTLLDIWSVSLMESLFAMTWAAYDKAKVEKVIRDFENKLKNFTTARTLVLSGRR